jgi:VanZ family protein
VLACWVAGILYGASDELHQNFVARRNCDVLDLAADSIGSLAGAIAHAAWHYRKRLRRREAA